MGAAQGYTVPMTRPQVLATAAVSVVLALYVGLIDYETRSVWQLFNAENAPFLLVVAMAAFGMLVGLQLAVCALVRRSRGSR